MGSCMLKGSYCPSVGKYPYRSRATNRVIQGSYRGYTWVMYAKGSHSPSVGKYHCGSRATNGVIQGSYMGSCMPRGSHSPSVGMSTTAGPELPMEI